MLITLNASNTATDIVGFVSDDPYERFESTIRRRNCSSRRGMNADIVYAAGIFTRLCIKSRIRSL